MQLPHILIFPHLWGAQVQFLSAGECINANPHEYNALMLDIARSFSLQRIMRCTQIMGRCAGFCPDPLAGQGCASITGQGPCSLAYSGHRMLRFCSTAMHHYHI